MVNSTGSSSDSFKLAKTSSPCLPSTTTIWQFSSNSRWPYSQSCDFRKMLQFLTFVLHQLYGPCAALLWSDRSAAICPASRILSDQKFKMTRAPLHFHSTKRWYDPSAEGLRVTGSWDSEPNSALGPSIACPRCTADPNRCPRQFRELLIGYELVRVHLWAHLIQNVGAANCDVVVPLATIYGLDWALCVGDCVQGSQVARRDFRGGLWSQHCQCPTASTPLYYT